MVMHARKQPRLDDGYMDKRDTHLFQSSQYPSKNYGNDSYGERYRRDGSSSDRYREESNRYRDNGSPSRHSPRYHNKSTYSEKTKDRYEKGPSSSDNKQVNHSYSQRSNSQNGSYDKGVKGKDPRDSKPEAQKPSIRSCGDWSEHISSSGMRYYYNCKTEVSQWEKPKDWSDGPGNKTESNKINDLRGTKTILQPSKSLDKSKHSGPDRTLSEKNLKRSMSDINYPHSGKPDKRYLIEKFQESQKQYKLDLAAERASHYRTEKSDSLYHRKDGYSDQHPGGSGIRRHRRDSEGNRSHGSGYVTPRKHNNELDDNMDISPGSTPTSSRPSSCANTPQLASTPISIPTPSPVTIATAAMPTSSAPLISSIPQLITQLSGGQNNQELTHKALQTLQKLQEVITRQIAQQTGPSSGQPQQSPRPTSCDSQQPHQHHQPHPHSHPQSQPHLPHPHSIPHSHPPPNSQPHAMPLHQNCVIPSSISVVSQLSTMVNTGHHHHHHHPAGPGSVYGKLNPQGPDEEEQDINRIGGESPVSEASHDLSCVSPGSSTTSSQNAVVNTAALTGGPGIQKESSLVMPPALSNYYNESLITHVKGWQAEHAEKQANKYWVENLNVDSLRCSQVSVELKRARSLVRIAEIQSTLHEQRILFLDQQVHELESMKPPMFSSSHSLTVPSSQ